MPEMHLEQQGFTYSVCGSFTKNKERIKRFMQTENTNYIYKNDPAQACFNMIWVMSNIKIWLKEQNQIKL